MSIVSSIFYIKGLKNKDHNFNIIIMELRSQESHMI